MKTWESRGSEGIGSLSSRDVIGRPDRRGFKRVICAGSPDGSEVWLVMLLGQTDGVDWLELVHHDQGVRPSGGIRKILAQGVKIPVLVQAACMLFYPDFFLEVPFSFSRFDQLAKRVGRELDLRENDLPLRAIEVGDFYLEKRLRDLRFWEGKMPQPNKRKILPLMEPIDWENLAGWTRNQIASSLQDPLQLVIGLVLDHLDEFVKFPKESVLLWKGCDRNGSATKKHEYPKALKEALDKRCVKRDMRSNGPAITSFLFSGGERPARNQPRRGWNIHHLYDGKITYCGRETSLHAVKEGNHFTQSAGLVAVHPVADALCDEVPAFSWYLRALSLQKFGYDPDGVFPGGRIDEYGFLHHQKTTVVYQG